MNRLSGEKAAYLKHSAYQKIDWYPWSEEAFERAKKEDKPVFLSSGAIWCHWCHVMAKECFENEEIIKLLNENFICIKLDRDERPDIDRLYQRAAVSMGSAGGWPLSVFMTPGKEPFFSGTYFPPDDVEGRLGFKRVLASVMDFYRTRRNDISAYTERLVLHLRPEPLLIGEINEGAVDEAVKAILGEFDPQNGGFGTSPKFPMPGAMELLINRAYFRHGETVLFALKKTLDAMSKGGFHDQIGGGFHRYSVDEGWIIPHFEKMAEDNAWLLRNYINAYLLTGDEGFKDVASGITSFVRDVLSDPDGGFYASEDADVTPGDEGRYFTWRDDEIRDALTPEEFRVVSFHLLHERGAMPHDRSKRVLFVNMEPDEIARQLGIKHEAVVGLIKSGKRKLLEERNKRKTPFVDRTLYTSLNGALSTACLSGFRVLADEGMKSFALKSLDRITALRFRDGELFHSEGVRAMLDDYTYLTEAHIRAYEATARKEHMEVALKLADLSIKNLWDEGEGGFFDARSEIMGLDHKGVEDIPHPSANAAAAINLITLYNITDDKKYIKYAERSLGGFTSRAKDLGIHGAYFFVALDAYFHTLRLTVRMSPASELYGRTLSEFHPYKCIVYEKDEGYVLPCLRGKCFEPVKDAEALEGFLRGLRS